MPTIVNPIKSDQFGLPRGPGGQLVGWLMAIGNRDMEHAVVRSLECRGDERVLEVGCGPGVGLRLLARRLPDGSVTGIDPSEVMRAQAGRRNRRSIAADRVELRPGRVPGLPFGDQTFDAVASVNNVMLWEPLDAGMRDVRRVLRPTGRIAIAVHDWVVPEPRAAYPARVVASMEAAGFGSLRSWRARNLTGGAFYFVGRRAEAA